MLVIFEKQHQHSSMFGRLEADQHKVSSYDDRALPPVCLASVYLLSSHVTRSPGPTPSVVSNQKLQLGTRLGHPFFLCRSLDVSSSPPDPTQWTEDQVYRWAEWTVQEFNLTSVNLSALKGISGHQLCSFTYSQFRQLGFNIRDVVYLEVFLNIIKTGKQVSL